MSEPQPDEPTVEVCGLVDESSVTLAIYGEELDPDEVTLRLSCQPSHSHRRGDRRGRHSPPSKKGGWFLNLRGEAPIGPEQFFHQLLLNLPSDESVWSDLASRFEIQLRIAAHFTEWNKEFYLPADQVDAISRMRASVVVDLYAYGERDIEPSSGQSE